MSTTSYDTALCIIPPASQCGHVDQLRELYDKAYGKWPPHINLVYPFVAPEQLPKAQEQIQGYLAQHSTQATPIDVELVQAGGFVQKNNFTVFLGTDDRGEEDSPLVSLRTTVLQALGQGPSRFTPHLTIGQTQGNPLLSQSYLLRKAQRLPNIHFRVGTLAILIREKTTGALSTDYMRLYGTIDIGGSGDVWRPHIPDYWVKMPKSNPAAPRPDVDETQHDFLLEDFEVRDVPALCFDPNEARWSPHTCDTRIEVESEEITVASYNVLVDTEYPPDHDRDPLIVDTILSEQATADILVLQEVSDDFLDYLLFTRQDISHIYPFVSHGPPCQNDLGPLPSLRNVVVLSRYPFSWHSVPFHRKHKSALVARLSGVTASGTRGLGSLVVAGIHLTAGLTDGSVATKKAQMGTLIRHLEQHYGSEPWVIAGDFNLVTSTYTIETSVKDQSISSETVSLLATVEAEIREAGLSDAWSVARVEGVDEASTTVSGDLFEGEEGATFDPQNNRLATGTTTTSHDRPQRYDRILFRSQDSLRIDRFNHFGVPEMIDGAQVAASDHYGVRAKIKVNEAVASTGNEAASSNQPAVEHKRVDGTLAETTSLVSVLETHGMFPNEDQASNRRDALASLQHILLGTSDDGDLAQPDIPLVIVPVGSYALGVWTADSDVDCLCIGTISSKTFFRLARQRLAKAEVKGVRILRKVEASTGTMLELSVNGIFMDLQYCPAPQVIERWHEFRNIPASDPIFNLSILSLRKLKPYRDLLYIQRTLPSLSAFRLAYRSIKLWAVQRGMYSAKFGFLGGVHITLMLSWVCKRLGHDTGPVTAADIIASFFHHYAQFDWTNDIVYDAIFHKKRPRYYRSAREPMVVLGYHAPNSNIAHTATVPGLQLLVKAFKTAEKQLCEPGMTWEAFFGAPSAPEPESQLPHGAAEFLRNYNNFVKVDIQFWGRTLAKGKSLVGWVESRCISLVIDIHKAIPKSEVQIWPARFVDSNSFDVGEGKEYQGCYLIGISKSEKAVSAHSADDKQVAKQALEKVLDRFLTQLRTDEKNFDASISWIDASLVRSSEVKGLRLDDREWGVYAMDMDSDSDDEEEIDEDVEDVDETKPQRTIPQRPKPTSAPLSRTKLRPASDVLNRLRWDPSLDPSDYIIGYEDRFLGAKETGLEKWKTEQTDEEFIPQHRILYFKKKGGEDGRGDVVWERATRIDKIFGSGLGSGE
ncbi:hypothetical protein J4E83_001754 [Alternaria metachromatica]|uniref:uncharacterized protein n=1 Tax=Alternaria metachromatica TaxID=283354 RepID=UPI0020C2DFBF|nr:uncharacterized protein J4E83_001754 [Alternaria metachromatica]KAI4634436.1 hypothetical protein J4E83_001754 [Alternaria metachromatica]